MQTPLGLAAVTGQATAEAPEAPVQAPMIGLSQVHGSSGVTEYRPNGLREPWWTQTRVSKRAGLTAT